VIVGAGVAGIEAVLALGDFAAGRVDLHLCDPRHEFAYRPFAVAEPYGVARSFRYELRKLGERCAASIQADAIVAVDPERRLAIAESGEKLSYDELIFATGARMRWAVAGAATFWGAADEGEVSEILARLRAGELGHVVFTMPAGHGWVLPLYELALLAVAERGQSAGEDARITVVTPESAPLEIFGTGAAKQARALLEQLGVELVTGVRPVRFERGRLIVDPGDAIEADAVVALPHLEGGAPDGVPRDRDGFIATDAHSRVAGLEDVYAVGDVSDFPFKQVSIAAEQADVAAEAIAAKAGAGIEPRRFAPVLRGVLWAGGEAHYLHGRGDDRNGDSGISAGPDEGPSASRVKARYFSPLVDAIVREEADLTASAQTA
jgi:sulfide:quinone oxidoreductase